MSNPFRKRTRRFDGPTSFRLIYTESGELWAVTPDNARWKCKPGTVFVAHDARDVEIDETAGQFDGSRQCTLGRGHGGPHAYPRAALEGEDG